MADLFCLIQPEFQEINDNDPRVTEILDDIENHRVKIVPYENVNLFEEIGQCDLGYVFKGMFLLK